LPDPASGLNSRLLDTLAALDFLVDFTIQEKVDLVVFAGDAYQRRDPSQTHQRELAKRVRRLSEAGIAQVMVVGNHDLPAAAGKANSLDIFSTLTVEGMRVASQPGIYVVPTRTGPVQVAALPWPRRGALLGREGARGQTIEELGAQLAGILTGQVSALAHQIDHTLPALFAGHLALSLAKTGSETTMMMGQETVMPLSAVALPDFDYAALGHVHRAQALSDRPWTGYAGSLIALDFGDEAIDKGFYIFELDPGRPAGNRVAGQPRFQVVPSRPFLTIEVRIGTEDPEPTATVLKAIAQRSDALAGAIVRVEITIPESRLNLMREADIKKALETAHQRHLQRNVQRDARTRLGDISAEGLAPSDALALYLKTRHFTEVEQQALLATGRRLIDSVKAGSEPVV
jgi:exonuclease SbcD